MQGNLLGSGLHWQRPSWCCRLVLCRRRSQLIRRPLTPSQCQIPSDTLLLHFSPSHQQGSLNSSLVVPQIHSYQSLWNCSSAVKGQLCEDVLSTTPHSPSRTESSHCCVSTSDHVQYLLIVKGIYPPQTMSLRAILVHSSMYSPGAYHSSWHITSVCL